MAHKNKVMQSINASGEILCVDIFRRPDGTFGFDEFRRDPEDPRGWYSVGHHAGLIFEREQDAKAEAMRIVAWLDEEP